MSSNTLYMDVIKTLESFNKTPQEFYDNLSIGKFCSGLYDKNIICEGGCSICPISSYRTEEEIKTWLGLDDNLPKKNYPETQNLEEQYKIIISNTKNIEERLNKLEKFMITIINNLSNKDKEIV